MVKQVVPVFLGIVLFLNACVGSRNRLGLGALDNDSQSEIYSEDVLGAVADYVAQSSDKGVFHFRESPGAGLLALELVGLTDPVRMLASGDYLACGEFHAYGEDQGKLFDIDFRVVQEKGKLLVKNVKIHKHPEFKNGNWSKVARYRFVDEKSGSSQVH